MTVTELQSALQAALDRGLPPETQVVASTNLGFQIVTATMDPTNSDYDLWFTLFPSTEADPRFTPGGLH